jgi:hypothetical protein
MFLHTTILQKPKLLSIAVLRIRDVYPGSRILIFTHPGSRISDPGSRIPKQEEKRVVKKNYCHTFFCSHKFHKIVNYFIFEMLNKKIWANFLIVTKLSKIRVWDPGSEIRDPEKTYSGSWIPEPGVKKAPDPGSRPQHWSIECILSGKNRVHYFIKLCGEICFSARVPCLKKYVNTSFPMRVYKMHFSFGRRYSLKYFYKAIYI